MATEESSRRFGARAPIAAIVAGCVALVGLAVTGAAKPLPGLDLVQTGHWVYNSALGSAFHIDGAGKRADAQVPAPDAGTGGQVVQGTTQGYILAPKITEFGKSTLSVEKTTPAPANERPVAIETKGGPYAVYRDAGTIIRLGNAEVKISAGGRLGDPVATADGRLWLHRVDDGLLCELAPDDDRVTCPITIPDRHRGSLAVTATGPVFVDYVDDTMRTISSQGLGDPVRLGIDVPETAVAASTDVDGRLAILDRPTSRLHFFDTTGLAKGRQPAAPVSIPLPPGDYVGLASSGSVVALVDKGNRTLRTYDAGGRQRDVKPIPSGGQPPTRGQDSRVYVDSEDGAHVLVVDHDGAVNEVPVTGDQKPAEDPKPVLPPIQNPVDDRQTGTPPPSAPQGGQPDRPVAPPQRQTQPPKTQTPVPASPPGAPRSVTATPGDGSATVKWNAATTNGAAITGYRVTWAGGEKTVGGGVRTTPITGLANGTAYAFTVTATNRAGTGPGTTSSSVTPRSSIKVPGKAGKLSVRIKTGDTDANVTWSAAAANGSPVTAYHVSWQRADGSGAGSARVGGSGRAHLIRDIGIEQPLTVTVVAENSAGRGAAASVTKARGDEETDRAITISRGQTTTADQCDPPVCAFVHIKMSGFTPGESLTITCYTSDGAHGSKTRTVLADGTLEFDEFPQGTVGRQVWIRAESIESNRITWK